MLENANTFYNGEWHLTELQPEIVRHKVTLMYHHHHPEGIKGIALTPKEGATVAETSQRFKEIEREYHHTNCGCCERIQGLQKVPFSSVFLASPEGDFQIPDEYQKGLVKPKGNFLHLDGLHRLVAWDLDGRFSSDREASVQKLRAYVAGPLA